MDKPTVHYKGLAATVQVGRVAMLFPVDHPNHLEEHDVSNQGVAITSRVLAHDPSTGRIETLNTIYTPQPRA